MSSHSRVRDLLNLAIQKGQEYADFKQQLKTRGPVPRLGDVVDIPGCPQTDGGIVFWAVIKRHPEDESLLCVVPCDSVVELVGTADLAIPPSERFGSVALRLGRLSWIHQDQLAQAEHCGFIDDRYVDKANFILHRITLGEWEGLPKQRETDCLPEYEEWMAEVTRARSSMLGMLHGHE